MGAIRKSYKTLSIVNHFIVDWGKGKECQYRYTFRCFSSLFYIRFRPFSPLFVPVRNFSPLSAPTNFDTLAKKETRWRPISGAGHALYLPFQILSVPSCVCIPEQILKAVIKIYIYSYSCIFPTIVMLQWTRLSHKNRSVPNRWSVSLCEPVWALKKAWHVRYNLILKYTVVVVDNNKDLLPYIR